MISNFERCLALVLREEGGYVDHPKDPGGATNLGITLNTFKRFFGFGTKANVKALTADKAGQIYRELYWERIRADELPAGVDLCVFDFAVNSGPARAVMATQRAVGVADDGKIGPITLAAIAKADPKKLVTAICTDRLSFLRRLSGWGTFGRGWSRRVASVERQALKMTDAKL